MKLGDKIYYTGDMANSEGFGQIVFINPPNRWAGETYDIAFDDGRVFKGIYPEMFDAGSGRRFWPLEEWQEDRQRRIELMKKSWA